MLQCQHRRRHQYCHLLAVVCSLEGSTDGYLCLAEAYIAADETVHWAGLLHILLHLLRRLYLVRGVLIEEGAFEIVLQIGVGREGKSLLVPALGIEFDEVAGNVLDMFLRTLLQTFPLTSAQGRETGTLATILRAVLRHLI